jgi:hypothetical protein
MTMITSATVPVRVTPEAAARVADLGLDGELQRMVDYACHQLPEATRIEVVLYERDEAGEPPGIGIEVYTPFDSYDPSARTRRTIGEWLVSEFPPRVLEHLLIDHLPETPNGGCEFLELARRSRVDRRPGHKAESFLPDIRLDEWMRSIDDPRVRKK